MANFLLILPVLLFSLVAHEFAHAWTAHREGDDTAWSQGRLTFNPLAHIDPFGTVLLPIMLWVASSGTFTFGSARPVPVDPTKYRRPVRGDLIVSSAGIVMNLLLAVVFAGLYLALGLAARSMSLDVIGTLQGMAGMGITINILLAFFNLVPVPPLDGSHLLFHALPLSWRAPYRRFGRFGFLLLILTLWLAPSVWATVLWPASTLNDLAHGALRPWTIPGR